MSEQAFTEGTFTAPGARRERLARVVLEQLGEEREVRLLDVGCGTGGQLLELAEALPGAELVGIDTSDRNIAAARAGARRRGLDARVSFVAANYLDHAFAPFDVIVADSVLQNVDAPDERLYAKLAGDLRPGGLLVVTMPYACAYNRVLWRLRSLLRRLRGPRLEAAALALGRCLHPSWDAALLAERLPYLYMLPRRVEDAATRGVLARAHALERVRALDLPHASLAQPKHRLSVYRKAGSR